MSVTHAEIVVVGAGIAGLACARRLADRGADPIVLDRGSSVGGRCATEVVADQPVDPGPGFFHGLEPGFFAALERVDATPLEGWPVRVEGKGAPCQPPPFPPGDRRLSFAEGVAAFPAHLGRGLDVRLGRGVARVALEPEAVRLTLDDGATIAARTVVLALPVEQAASLLAPLRDAESALASALVLLDAAASVPCLTVVAGYPSDVPEPSFDVLYPDTSAVVHAVLHDSAKRPAPRHRVLVAHTLPRYARRHDSSARDSWSAEVLGELGRLVGPWAAQPAWSRLIVWPLARLAGGSELAAPLLVETAGRARIGLAGELFAPQGGAQAAWLSGTQLADRCLGKELG